MMARKPKKTCTGCGKLTSHKPSAVPVFCKRCERELKED